MGDLPLGRGEAALSCQSPPSASYSFKDNLTQDKIFSSGFMVQDRTPFAIHLLHTSNV